METSPKGFSPIIIVLTVIAVLAVGGMGVWYYSQTAKPKSVPAINNEPVQKPIGQNNSQPKTNATVNPATTQPVQGLDRSQNINQSENQQNPSTSVNEPATFATRHLDPQEYQLNYPGNDLFNGDGPITVKEILDCSVPDFSTKCPNTNFIGKQNCKNITSAPADCAYDGELVKGGTPSCIYEDFGDVAMGTIVTGYYGLVVRDGKCFMIQWNLIHHNCDNYDKTSILYQECIAGDRQREINNEQMLSNFKLTGFVSRQTTAPAVCGNGKCETGEDVFSCPQDCPQVDQSVTELIPPRNVDVSTCTDGKGNIYPTEGASNYARWFIWNGCVAKKMFALSNTVGVANKPLILYVYGDSCATCKCQNPNFDVYEARGDGAYKVASINLSNQPVSSGAGQTTNLHSYFYAPESYAFFIATEAHSCFYMKVYQGDEASLKRNFPSWENLPVNIQGPISM